MGTRRLVRPLVAVAALLATVLAATPASAKPPPEAGMKGWIRSTIARMTLEEKVGQL